jgi:arginase family enzyme
MIVKVPGINGNGETDGCEKAPNEILKSLNSIYSNEQGKVIDIRLLDLEEIHLDNSNLKLSNELIYKNSFEMFEIKPKVIFLGGDHSISYSIGRAFLEYCKQENKEPCLIVFSAHGGCVKSVKEPIHEKWLRKLIKGGFPGEKILLVGVRNLLKEEIIFLKENGIHSMNISKLIENLEDACDTIMEFSNGKELYVSIDISVIDPVFAPAVRNSEPGGLTSRQFLYLISRINKIKNLRAVDLVNINPDKDENNITVKLGAKILGELI